jgi:hypothetical protein
MPDERSAGRFGTPGRSCTRQAGWGMPCHFWRRVPSLPRKFSIYGSPSSKDDTPQVRLKGKVKENGRPLRRSCRDGGVRLVRALGRSESVRRARDSFLNMRRDTHTYDLQKSYEAYLSSFTSYLLLTPILSTLSSTLPLVSIFVRDEVKSLADVIQRLTAMGACDLLLGSKTSLVPTMRECGLPKVVVGAVTEWQAQCLEDGVWKGDVKAVIKFLLGEAREAYGAERPIRATRSVRGLVQGWG